MPPCLIVQPKLILALRSASQPIFLGDSQTSLSKKKFLQLPSKFVSSLTLFVNQIKYLHFSKKNILLGVSRYDSTGRGERLQQEQEETQLFLFWLLHIFSRADTTSPKFKSSPQLNYTALTTTTRQRSCT